MNRHVKEEAVALAECLDCGWHYQPQPATATPHGTMALRRAREHALLKAHRTLVHRTTEYDGKTP